MDFEIFRVVAHPSHCPGFRTWRKFPDRPKCSRVAASSVHPIRRVSMLPSALVIQDAFDWRDERSHRNFFLSCVDATLKDQTFFSNFCSIDGEDPFHGLQVGDDGHVLHETGHLLSGPDSVRVPGHSGRSYRQRCVYAAVPAVETARGLLYTMLSSEKV